MENRKLWFWLNNIEGIGNIKLRNMLEIFKNPENVYASSPEVLRKIPSLTDTDVANICNEEKRKYIFEIFEKYIDKGIKFVFPCDENYPKRLQELYDKPGILYYRGDLPIEDRISISIVGSRRCTEYGKCVASEIAGLLAERGANVISGLALGIDSAAHRGALKVNGRTYAVLAGSAYKCYPPGNHKLYMDIINSGGAISEFSPDTPTVPGMFPLRNRIISGMSDVVIVVEAAEKSGSLITVSHALEQNRQVYAVPGRIGDGFSAGCNRLIAEGAGIIVSYETLLEELGFSIIEEKNSENENLSLAREEKMLYSLLLDFTPRSLDTIISLTGEEPKQVLRWLLGLELKGYIKEISKNFYIRIR